MTWVLLQILHIIICVEEETEEVEVEKSEAVMVC